MGIDFSDLSPAEFENLCFEYTKKIYTKENYQLEHTRYIHDGGKDIEVLFYDQLSHIKIWAECKHHTRAIGLEELGKNVVLVIAKQVNRILFFSSSEIRQSAQVTINKIGNAFNFDVSYLYGNKLMHQIKKYPDLIEMFFNQRFIEEEPTREITIRFAISEQESDILIPIDIEQKTVILKKGRIFNLYIMLGNYTDILFQNVQVTVESCPSEILFIDTYSGPISFPPNTDQQIELKGEIINRQNPLIASLEVCIAWEEDGSEKEELHTYLLPQLDISACKNYPLIGKSVNEFLANHVSKAISWAERAYPQVLSIYGSSGVGKSRLAEEIETKTREHYFSYIWLNGTDYDDCDLIRFLFYNLLQLPIGSGKINFEKKDIRELIVRASGSQSFAKMLSDFLVDGTWRKKDMHYLVDAFVHFFCNPIHKNKQCIILDNLQKQNSTVLQFLTHVVNALETATGKGILVLVTNTEIIPTLNQTAIANFLEYMQEKSKEHKLSHYLCPPLSEEDRRLFLIQLLHIDPNDERILSQFLDKVGSTPFEIVMMLEYLGENGIIEWTTVDSWHIKILDSFTHFLHECPKPTLTILASRLAHHQKFFSTRQLKDFKEIVSSILCFRGFIPYTYLSECIKENSVIDELQRTLWVMDAPSGKGLRFFHDNIYRFFSSKPEYVKNSPVILRVLTWLNKHPDIGIDKREKIIFYGLYNTGNLSKAKKDGLLLLEDFYKQKRYSDGADIGCTLFFDDEVKRVPLDHVKIGVQYAANLFELQDKDRASEVFREIIPIMLEHKEDFSLQELCGNLHTAINTQLQTAHYKLALNFVHALKKLSGKSEVYEFIAENREGVTQLCLGNFHEAECHFELSLEMAKDMQNNFWISTTQSDMALLYFYNWTIKDYALRCNKVLATFEAALENHEESHIQDDQREIEMAWHRIFVEILKENYDEAIALAKIGMEKSEKENNLYGYIRSLNLQGVSYLLKGETTKAISLLQSGKHICEIDRYSSGLFRMHNNLGVAYYLKNEIIEALREFELAKATEAIAEIEVKQQPVLSNLLLLYQKTNNHEGMQGTLRQCDALHSTALKEYRTALKKGKKFNFAFWTFDSASYIF